MANTPQPKKRKRKIRRNNTFLDGRWIHWKTKLYREEREMNIGVIGYGNIAKRFAQSIKHTKNGKVSAIGSKSLAQDAAFQACHPEIQVYETYDALLADPTIEGIYIALPHAFHKEWALKALALNIPVLCEKPAVLTVADMEEIIDVATAHETLFVEAFKTKYNLKDTDLISVDTVTASIGQETTRNTIIASIIAVVLMLVQLFSSISKWTKRARIFSKLSGSSTSFHK